MIELGVHTDNRRTLSGNFRGEPKGDILICRRRIGKSGGFP